MSLPTTMQATVLMAPHRFEVLERPVPRVGPEDCLVRVRACGICGTDARTFFNGDPRAPAPWVLGHEPVGILERAGPEAVLPPGVEVGGRMFLGSILTCGQCLQCTDGRQNLCEHHLLYGYDPFPGAYAELAAVPALPPLELALILLTDEHQANGAADRRRALELVAEEMEARQEFPIARRARMMAWSEDTPTLAETSGLADSVRAQLALLEPDEPEEEAEEEADAPAPAPAP